MTRRLEDSRVVFRKRKIESEQLLGVALEAARFAGDLINRAWNERVGGAVVATRSRLISSRKAAEGELNRLDAICRDFGRSDGFKGLTADLMREGYALGALYIRQRDAEIRRRRGLPALEQVKKASPKSPAKNLVVDFDFSLADERALERLTGQQLLWFRDIDGLGYSTPAARDAILERATSMIDGGASSLEVAQSLADAAEDLYGVGRFSERGLNYWAGVAETAATNASVQGSLNELQAIGWTRYEIINPMDERTTPVCAMLNGKTMLVSDAVSATNALNSLTSIEDVQASKPFVSGGSTDRVTAVAGNLSSGSSDLSSAQSNALAEAGFAVPPYHFRCRSFIDIAVNAGDPVPVPEVQFPTKAPSPPPTPSPTPSPAPSPAAAAQAMPETPPTKPLPLPEESPAAAPASFADEVAPAAAVVDDAPSLADEVASLVDDVATSPAPPPAPVATPAEVMAREGFPFDLNECTISPMELGGMGKKFVIEAPDGSLWMFKDYSEDYSTFRIAVDKLAEIMGRAGGLEYAETHALTIPRDWAGFNVNRPRYMSTLRERQGSVARLYSPREVDAFDVGGGVSGVNIETLTAAQRLDIQTDHALNWILSNGDSHYENYIMLSNGRVSPIDKGQGFRFFGRDRLEWDYRCPNVPIPSTRGLAYPESQLTRYANGELGDVRLVGVYEADGSLTELGARIKAMQDVPDDVFVATMQPYAEEMHSRGIGVFADSVQGGLDRLLARKNSLLDDYADFYERLEAQRLARVAPPPPPLTAQEEFLRRRNIFGGEPEDVLAAIREDATMGHTVFVGGASVEDMSLHGIRYRIRGETGERAFQFQFAGRLRPSASDKLRRALDERLHARAGSGARRAVPMTAAEEIAASRARIADMWEGGTADFPTGINRFIRSFNARHVPSSPMYGQEMGAYVAVYDDLLRKLDEIADLRTAAQRLAAEETLGYAPTAAEVAAAKRYREVLRAYKRADGSWNADNIVDNIGLTEQIVPARVTANRRPGVPTLEEVPAAREHEVVYYNRASSIDHLGRGSDGMIEVLSDYASETAMNDVVQKHYSFTTAINGSYRVRHATNTAVELRFSPHTTSQVTATQAKGDFRIIFNRANPTAADFADARRMLEDLGVSLAETGQTFPEMRVLWARKQARAMGLDLDADSRALFANIPDSLPPEEQLRRLEAAFDHAAQEFGNPNIRWGNLTRGMRDEDFMPVFREDGLRGRGGHPQWIRRDLDLERLERAGIHGAYSEITGTAGPIPVIESMLGFENPGMVATAHRARNGTHFYGGMGPGEDFSTGGANYVFTRINLQYDTSAALRRIEAGELLPERSGIRAGVYYSRRATLYSDNLFYRHDHYGRVSSSEFIDEHMVKTFKTTTPEDVIRVEMSKDSRNEICVKRSLGFEDVDVWVLSSQEQRAQALEVAARNGVTEINGRPVEQFFLAP